MLAEFSLASGKISENLRIRSENGFRVMIEDVLLRRLSN